MRSVTVLHTEWSTGWGGQEIRIINEARGVAAHGHRVVIVAGPDCRILGQARSAGLPTYTLPMRRAMDPGAVLRLARIIRREHVDILNTHSSVDSWIGAFAAKLTGIKLVRTRHVSSPLSRHPLNFVHRMPDVIVTTGEAICRQLIEHNGLRADRVISVPTGVDTAHFSPRPCTAEFTTGLGLRPEVKIVTAVGVLRGFKRHDVLVNAAAHLHARPDLCVLIAGEGSQREPLEQLIHQLALTERVRLLGHVDDIRPLLSCSDVVVSSSGSHEGVPQALAQALAMARPVVATDAGSTAELVVHERTGLLVPPNDPAVLAAAIERMLREPSLARDCGTRGRTHVLEHYSYEGMIERVIALYNALLGRPR